MEIFDSFKNTTEKLLETLSSLVNNCDDKSEIIIESVENDDQPVGMIMALSLLANPALSRSTESIVVLTIRLWAPLVHNVAQDLHNKGKKLAFKLKVTKNGGKVTIFNSFKEDDFLSTVMSKQD